MSVPVYFDTLCELTYVFVNDFYDGERSLVIGQETVSTDSSFRWAVSRQTFVYGEVQRDETVL